MKGWQTPLVPMLVVGHVQLFNVYHSGRHQLQESTIACLHKLHMDRERDNGARR